MKNEAEDAIKRLYPFVDESATPLPRCWSSTDKWHFLGVSHNNLRVTYRGQGKNHKDAAAVRTSHPIPPKCGIYYFEVRIISKGRDGYMGIGVCQKDVSLNRLPGWDRCSFGYHGDDGNFFCSSGSGVPYGPTFTTGDVIGCGVNLVENSCFYTKNGQNLGTAYTDLPVELYPTVGLQTPGEVVDTNFGQLPFVYQMEAEIREAQLRVHTSISRFCLPMTKTQWFNKLVSSYLVHHGYCASAESFNQLTAQQSTEDPASMKNRQKLQRYVMSGRISDCIQCVNELYPGLLEKRGNLLFLLKCRQFIEMVSGTDSSPSPHSSNSGSPSTSPHHKSSLFSPYPKGRISPASKGSSPRDSPRRIKSPKSRSSPSHLCEDSGTQNGCSTSNTKQGSGQDESLMDCTIENGSSVENGSASVSAPEVVTECEIPESERRCSASTTDKDSIQNGSSDPNSSMGIPVPEYLLCGNVSCLPSPAFPDFEDCGSLRERMGCGGQGVERLVTFGRDLLQLSFQVKDQSQKQKKMMQDGFSLMAYKDPFNSPVAYLLRPEEREPVAAALNSAILEELGYPSSPPLEVLMAHARRLREEMAENHIGSTAFNDPDVLCGLGKTPREEPSRKSSTPFLSR